MGHFYSIKFCRVFSFFLKFAKKVVTNYPLSVWHDRNGSIWGQILRVGQIWQNLVYIEPYGEKSENWTHFCSKYYIRQYAS